MAAETIVIDIVANFKNQTSAGMNSAKQSTDRFTDSVQKAKREADRLGGTHAKPKVSITDRASSTLNKIDSSLKAIGGKTFRAGVKILDYATTPLKAIKNSLFSIKGLVAAVGTGLAANQLIMNPINLADSYSSAKIGFSTLLGDDEGQKMMDKIDQFAKETPFKTSGVINNVQKMMAMGWDPQSIIKDMETIGDAAAATGKGDEGLASITYALSEIRSKGKLSTQELNQLASAGIKAKAYLAEGLGYGTSDAGMKKLAEDLEKGAIGAEKAIELIMQGMEEFDGMMDRTANETVSGLKSQLEDVFEINIARKWGQGLQDGAKRGLGSIVELLDRSEDGIKRFGEIVYDVGKELSNWAADKLEGTIDKILEISKTDEFKNASLFGKGKILWDEIIAKPFGEWWKSKGKPYIADKMAEAGEAIGSGLSKGFLALLGVDVIGATGEAASIGGSFASGFAKGFEGKKVWDAIVKAAGRAFTSGFKSIFNGSALERIIVGGLALKVTSGILSGISTVQTLWSGTGAVSGTGGLTLGGMGLKGIIGSSASGTGLLGWGANTAIKMGAGNLAGGASVGTLGLSAMGLGSAAGIALGIAGLGSSISDLTSSVQSQTKNDKKLYGTRSATKAGLVGAGTVAGAAIGSFVPVIGTAVGAALGAGIGGLGALLGGNKLADSISGVSKTTEELNEQAEKDAIKNLAERFGKGALSADQLAERVQEVFGIDSITRVNRFNSSLKDLATIQSNLANNKFTVDYASQRITAGETLSASDIQGYQAALENYASYTSSLLSNTKSNATAAYQLLYGDDTEGLQKATKSMNSMYTKLEEQLAERSEKLNEVIADAFSDGKITIDEEKKINEIVKQIEEIEKKIEERLEAKEAAKRDAAYDLIGMKYKDEDLTADSFKKLMSELNSQSQTDQQAYDDAYIEASADLKLQLQVGEIDQTEYDKKIKEVERKWREGKAISVKQTVNVAFDVIETKYDDEFEKINKGKLSDSQFINLSESSRDTYLEDVYKQTYGMDYNKYIIQWGQMSELAFQDARDSFLESAGITEDIQKEMKQMYETLKPQEEDLQELKESYEKAGEEVPQWINDSLDKIANIKLMTGEDMDSFYKIIGEQLAAEDPQYARYMRDAKEKGQKIPQALIDGLNEGLKDVEVKTNLKLTADETDIDTSDFDKTTQDVLEKLQDEGILRINKKGKVVISTKDGKVDTTGLDEDTAAAVRKLEEDGVIKISKDGEVTINASVDTADAKSKTESETEGALGQDQSVNKTANVNVDSTTSGEGEAADKSKGEVKSALDQRFGTSISENGKVKVNKVSVSAGEAIATAWSNFKQWVKDKFSIGVDVTSNVRVNQRMGTTDHSENDPKKANGGYVDRAIRTIVGEAGPEMIIPLSANRRQRGKALWERAGRAMGLWDNETIMNANGGLYGLGSSRLGDMMNSAYSGIRTESTQETGRSGSVNVEVGGVHITIQSGDNGAAESIKQNADNIAGIIADALEEAFQNMPITAGT